MKTTKPLIALLLALASLSSRAIESQEPGDVTLSPYFWSVLLRRTEGPWMAVTVIENAR